MVLSITSNHHAWWENNGKTTCSVLNCEGIGIGVNISFIRTLRPTEIHVELTCKDHAFEDVILFPDIDPQDLWES